MRTTYPSIAICGIGSVTVTIIYALYQNQIPFKILCRNQTRFQSLTENPISFQGPNGKVVRIELNNHLTMTKCDQDKFDYILIGCKNQNLSEYLDETKSLLKSNGKWILIQNGIPELQFQSYESKIIGGVVGWNTQTLSKHTYFQSNIGSLILGEAQGSEPDSFWKKILTPFIPVILTDELSGYRWHKLAINSIINGLAAAKQLSLGGLFLNRQSRIEALETLTEIKLVMNRLEIKERVVPGSVSIQKLGGGPGSLPRWICHLILILLGLKYFKIRTSMVQDLDAHRKTEIDFINGEVVDKAKELGISVSRNEWIVRKIKELELAQ
ncbi:ketopantoate reductase family protein [Leptospira sp. 2 VSF19]|uniref:2-dehydropantoate 2-reductase n=1 Tax=Leptospira soteropolitanensis TaxID=2950025 RepID=A0AAW5VQL5_9LEPT|nr:ketopantoate reductase C-terminal domain-containing protein [Leptospira soteropolitanensis]MCW7493613.1 ketopantoate reductase family protein [Leptospira soteropolitanensis]MCW7501212.1 ketopantoate reductase family protein [Leptospira soteropolitanensis]MCW7523602.1 ketopantoate reductase family protein [Leptospira soteropolitanensis]MCW7527325.1 ketopantoate reductase family protein [Leptospira soteropolitanensis]MCW7531182.1 ketopantoate reductase family protein [Leptospira soteropolitan